MGENAQMKCKPMPGQKPFKTPLSLISYRRYMISTYLNKHLKAAIKKKKKEEKFNLHISLRAGF